MTAVDSHTVEGFAELLHHYYHALGPDFGCSDAGKAEWQALPANERRRLVAATRLAPMETESSPDWRDHSENTGRNGTEGRECGC